MNPLAQSAPYPPGGPGTIGERLRHRWGWFIALGLLISVLGLGALFLVVSATIVSVFAIAIFMVIAGGAEVVMGFNARNWCRFILWIFGGIAYVIVGAFALAQPWMAAAVFTLVLGTAMVAMGLIRLYVGAHLGAGARAPALFAGLVTVAVGAIIILGWPANSFVVLGLLLGLDLMFWGASWVALGLRLRALA
ncbi:MAG: HdeD family acid-resistance protein [Methylovirgula sp.]